jgi:cell wall assembly regulator SMI1
MPPLSERELRLVEAPQDDVAWRGYADELRERGDPRAEVVAQELAGADGSPARELVERNAREYLGLESYDSQDPDPGLWFEWRHGFVMSLIVDLRPRLLKWPPLVEQLARFLDSPAAHLLRRIDVRRVESGTEAAYLPHLVAQPRPALRELRMSAEEVGAVSGTTLAGLERLTLRNTKRLAPIALPCLSYLSVESRELTAESLDALATSSLPRLAHLRLLLGTADAVKPKKRPKAAHVLQTLAAHSRVRELAIHGVPFGDELLAGMAGAPNLEHLESLELSGVELGAVGLQALRDLAGKSARLATITLDRSALGAENPADLPAKVVPWRPSARTVARFLTAMTAECVAAKKEQELEDATSRRAAQRIRRWAGLWTFEELSALDDHASAPAAAVLAWALDLQEDPFETADLEALAARAQVEGDPDTLARDAAVRDAEELESLLLRTEAEAAEVWAAYGEVTALREQARAARWLVGAAASWREVPTHLALHDLPAPEITSRETAARVERAWAALRKRFKQPPPGPASKHKVDRAERELGRRFPADLRASLLRHGGASYPPLALLSLDAAVAFWRDLDRWTDWHEEPRPRSAMPDETLRNVQLGSWRRAWFPITSAEYDSDFHAADLDPASGGTCGQVLFCSHEIPGPECVMSDSFVGWLEWAVTSEAFEPADEGD